MTKALICVIGTGGTIASRFDPALGGHVAAASPQELVAAVPRLDEIAQIEVLSHSNINSALMDTSTAFRLRDTIRNVLRNPRMAGVVVTHGTATLEETAYLLDLTLETDVPVVITGAQRNFDVPDPDGPRNLEYAVRVAADPSARGRGVMVAVAGEILAARDALKSHTESVQCFAARDGGPIGMVTASAVTFLSRPERREHLDVDRVEDNVQLIRMAQGANDLLLRSCVQAAVPGIVVEASAGGNVNEPFYEGIVAALDANIPVVVATRVAAGPTHLGKGYRGSLMSLLAKGAIAAGYLSGIKARILLMVALGKTRKPSEIAEIFRRAGGNS